MDFSQRTREDFINFDARREQVMQPTQEEIKQTEREQFESKKTIVIDILQSYDIELNENMGGQSNWIAKYFEFLNKNRTKYQILLGSEKVFANLEDIVKERTNTHSKNQLKGFVDFVYELEYNPILDN